jgi:hypothetical protein
MVDLICNNEIEGCSFGMDEQEKEAATAVFEEARKKVIQKLNALKPGDPFFLVIRIGKEDSEVMAARYSNQLLIQCLTRIVNTLSKATSTSKNGRM